MSGRKILDRGRALRPEAILRARLGVAVLAGLALLIACGQGEPAEHSTDSPSEVEEYFAHIVDTVDKGHQSAEGREGILAEEKLYSIFDEELIIRDFFQDRRDGFYLDVGCAGPVKGSNTYYLEKNLGWTGIGVDALADYGPAWAAERPNSRFLAYLVSDRSDETEKFYKSSGRGISSTDQQWATGQAFGIDLPTEEMQIGTITLDDLLDRQGVTKIDLMSMDIEGHEQKALAGFDIERFRPELIVIERQASQPKNREVQSYFQRHGYQRIKRYRPFDTVNDYYRPKRAPAARSEDQPTQGR